MPDVINVVTSGEGLGGREFPYSQVSRLVGGFTATSVIEACAALNNRYPHDQDWLESPDKVAAGWNLAELSRMSLIDTRRGGKIANQEDLLGLGRRSLLVSSNLDTSGSNEDATTRWMLRQFLLQFPYQTEPIIEVLRAIQILKYTDTDKPLQEIVPGWDERILGASLLDYIASILMVRTVGLTHNNRIGHSSFDQATPEIAEIVDVEIARHVIFDKLATSQQGFRDIQDEFAAFDDDLGPQFRFNPFRRRPYVQVAQDSWVTPVNTLPLMKATTSGIFYEVPTSSLQRFGTDLGNLFEQYVGDQLRTMTDVVVEGERSFLASGRNRSDTIDWVLLLPTITVFVEVKARRPISSMATGSEAALEDLKNKLDDGLRQLRSAHEQWMRGEPQYDFVPRDKPVVGLVVTLEDFHLHDRLLFRERLENPGFPVSVISARELEQLVTVPTRQLSRDLGRLNLAANGNILEVETILHESPRRANPLLRATARKAGWLFEQLERVV